MAFNVQNFERITSGAGDAPFEWAYRTADTLATVAASAYFDEVADGFKLGDLIYIVSDTGTSQRTVSSATSVTPVTTAGYIFTGQIQTTDIDNNAVTADKIAAAVAGDGLAGGAGTALSVTVDTVGIEINVDTLRVKDGGVSVADLNYAIPKTVTVSLTPSQFNGMYAAPVVLVAGVAGYLHRVHSVAYEVDYGGTAFVGGGAVAVQYHSTAAGLGTLASATVADTVFTGYTADSTVGAASASASAAASTTVARGLYLSNATAAFTTGSSTVRVHLTYSSVPVSV